MMRSAMSRGSVYIGNSLCVGIEANLDLPSFDPQEDGRIRHVVLNLLWHGDLQLNFELKCRTIIN